jgi:photosystem II stability/assembly factor-like uncharacterized protein
MFEHLDDPQPPPADPSTLRLVRARARGIHQRRLTALTVSLAVLLAVAVGSALAVRGPAPQPRAHETSYQFNARPDPLPVGTAVPPTALFDVQFVNDREGFGLAEHRNHAVLAETSDGGSTWDVVDGALPAAYAGDGVINENEMEFASPTAGYLWTGENDGSTGSRPMWVTADGGRSWTQAPIGPVVYDVSAIGADVWALVGTCPTLGPGCSVVAEISLDGGASWLASGAAVPAAAESPTITSQVELARITPDRAYVLSTADGAGADDTVVAYTDDGGTTWSTRPAPCSGPFALGAYLAASSSDDLWLLCGGQASAGYQLKELYRSSDGGMTWTLTAGTTGFGSPPPLAPGEGELPAAGYVAPLSIGHKTLDVASPALAWLSPVRGEVSTTTDGGRTWQPVAALQAAGFNNGAPGNLTFVSDTEGWICELGVGVWRTTDGTTWAPLGDSP